MVIRKAFLCLCILLIAQGCHSVTLSCSRKIYPGFFHSTFTCEMDGMDLVDSDELTVEESMYLLHLKVFNSGIAKLPVRLLARLVNLQSVSFRAKIHHVDELSLKKVAEIDLSSNEIHSLAEWAFAECPNLRELDLHDNKISVLPEKIFNGLSGLESVNIAENKIKHLPSEIFSQTPSLEVFWAQFNALEELKLEILAHLTVLKQLDFSHNRLKRVEAPETLLSMTSVISSNLQLGFNQLDSLSLQNTDILSINVSRNQLRKITLGRNCKELIAEDNEIREISFGKSLKSLEVLKLAGNQLKNNLGDICQCENLQEIILDSNGIENPGFCFATMHTLRLLNLKRNRITHIDYGYFHGGNILETLDLSYNSIETVDSHALSLLHNLKSLYLDGNRIDDLTDQLATILPQLTVIGLSHNRFQCDRLLTIFRQLKATKKDIVLNIDKPAIVNTTNIHGMACFNTKFNTSTPNLEPPSAANASIWREVQKIKFELQDYSSLVWKMVKSHEILRDGIAANFSQLRAENTRKKDDKSEEFIDGVLMKNLRKFMQMTNTRVDSIEARFNESIASKSPEELSDKKSDTFYHFIGIFAVILVIFVGFAVIWYHSDKVCIKYCLYRKISLRQSGESLRTFA